MLTYPLRQTNHFENPLDYRKDVLSRSCKQVCHSELVKSWRVGDMWFSQDDDALLVWGRLRQPHATSDTQGVTCCLTRFSKVHATHVAWPWYLTGFPPSNTVDSVPWEAQPSWVYHCRELNAPVFLFIRCVPTRMCIWLHGVNKDSDATMSFKCNRIEST